MTPSPDSPITAPVDVLFYVQHLLGIGHLRRASVLAAGLRRAGLTVVLVTGGPPVPTLDLGAEGRPLAQNIVDFWNFAKANDLVVAPHFVDPQADRSDPDAHARARAAVSALTVEDLLDLVHDVVHRLDKGPEGRRRGHVHACALEDFHRSKGRSGAEQVFSVALHPSVRAAEDLLGECGSCNEAGGVRIHVVVVVEVGNEGPLNSVPLVDAAHAVIVPVVTAE